MTYAFDSITIHQGCAWELATVLPDASINTVITSPPYYSMRDYGVEGAFGLEKTVDEYVSKLVELFRLLRPALTDCATVWLNLGDTYAGGGRSRNNRANISASQHNSKATLGGVPAPSDLAPKQLLGIPWRVALALQADGWYLRQDIIWHKLNAMPESVKDRCTKAHEYIFLLSKSPRYYFDHEAIKERAVGFDKTPPRGSIAAFGQPQQGRRKGNATTFRNSGKYTGGKHFDANDHSQLTSGNKPNDTGLRSRRSVWATGVANTSFTHFATFPKSLVRPAVLAGCPGGGTVLDPFFGSGTTGEVARELGRKCIGFELNQDYIDLAIKHRFSQMMLQMEGVA